jgi:hypothetical protein
MSIRWLRRQGDQPQLLKNDCPNLPREDTGHQNMLDSLPDLITKRACSGMNFRGAQLFQIRFQGANLIVPMKKAS